MAGERYRPDTSGGPDSLRAEDDARTIAIALASSSLQPPLTLGIFGPWGAGKTFLMNRIREQVEKLVLAQPTTEASPYVRRITQLEFNAWQYAESNLWASLAQVVLRGLTARDDPGGSGSREQLLAQLDTSVRARAELEAAHAEARDRLADLDQRQAFITERGEEVTRDLEALEKPDWVPGADTALALNFAPAPTLRSLVLARPTRSVVVAALVLFASFALTFGFSAYISVPGIGALLAGTAGGVAWSLTRRAQSVADKRNMESAVAREHLREQRRKIERESRQVEDALVAAKAELNEAEAALATRSPDLLAQFIKERTDPTDSQQLGILVLLRNDFDKLSQLLGQLSEDTGGERVIVYIDDLDRCPSERVVAVLEAIHLLLAFPLFVVVVAVDPRWISAALRQHFGPLLGGNIANGSLPDGHVASPRDYIEKIFQVPLWLRRIDDDDARELVRTWMGTAPPPSPSRRPDPTAWAAVTSEEASLALELAPLAGTSPRAIKRYLNMYWFVRAATGAATDAPFAADTRAIAMLVLAVANGAPHLAPYILDHLRAAKPETPLKALLTSLDSVHRLRDSPGWARVRQYLHGLSTGTEGPGTQLSCSD